LNLAQYLTSTELVHESVTYSGKNIYKDVGNREMIMYDSSVGFWKYISPPPVDYQEVETTFSDEDALIATEELFEQFGLPLNEKAGHTATAVGESDMGSDGIVSQAREIARHVRLYREVNGLRVWGSKMMATYTLDGRVFRIGVDWPPFKVVSNIDKAVDRETAIKDLAKTLGDSYTDVSQILEMKAQIVYLLDKNVRAYDPTVLVHIRPTNEENGISIYRYSLTRGMYNEESAADATID